MRLTIHKVFFYLLLMFLPTQLGLHFWPSWALVLGRRVDYLSPTLFLTDLLISLLLISWLVTVISRIKHVVMLHKKYVVLIFCFAILNIVFAAGKLVAFWTWIKFFEFVLLGVYIVSTKPNFGRVVLSLSIGVLYSSLLAVSQFILQHSIGGPLWLLGERSFSAASPGIAQISLCLPGAVNCPLLLRPYATFSHPNVLGGFLAVTIPIILYQFTVLSIAKQRKLKFYYGLTLVLGAFALLFSFSRSAWFVGVLGSAFLYFEEKRRPQTFRWLLDNSTIILFLGIVLVTIMLFVPLPFFGNGESIVVRRDLAISAIRIWQHAPLMGVGLGNFLPTLPYFLPSRTIYFLQPAHNIYLLLLSETGIVGMGVFGFIIWSIIRNETKNGRISRYIYRASLVALLLLGLVDHYALTLQQGRLLLTILASLALV